MKEHQQDLITFQMEKSRKLFTCRWSIDSKVKTTTAADYEKVMESATAASKANYASTATRGNCAHLERNYVKNKEALGN
jgi:hypothetical protein